MPEISKSTLTELFQRDPLQLSNADIDTMIEGFRQQRGVWAGAEATAKASGTRVKTGAMISLADLDLKL